MQEIEYAKALFDLASNNNEMLDEFQKFNEILEYNQFLELLKAPNIKKEEKKEILKKTLKNFDVTFLHFLFVIIDNNRINDLDQIYDCYYKMVLKSNNEELVDIYLPKEISEKELESLKNKLELKFNKKLVIRVHIESKLIGGMRIEYDGKSIDETVLKEFIKIKSLL